MKRASRQLALMIIGLITLQATMPRLAAYAQSRRTSQAARALFLPDARTGQMYEYQLKSTGGMPPFRWRVVDGELPPGIRLSVTGKLKGVPTIPSAEPSSFVVEVSDSSAEPEGSERLVQLLVRPRRLTIEGAAEPMRITTGDEPEADSLADSPRQSGVAYQRSYAPRERNGSPREFRHPLNRRPPPARSEDPEDSNEDDAATPMAKPDDTNQEDPSHRIVGGQQNQAKFVGDLNEGDVAIRVAAAPHTPVTVLVNNVIAGKAVTNKYGRALVSIGEPLPKGASVDVVEGSGPATSSGPPHRNGNGPAPATADDVPSPSSTPPPNIDVPVRASDQKITGTATPKQKVTVSLNGTALGEVEVKANGTFEVAATLSKGDKITAKQDDSLDSVTITVEPAEAPSINPLLPGATAITGKGSAKAEIKAILDGHDLAVVNALADGTYTVTPPQVLKPGQYVKVQQNDGDFAEATVAGDIILDDATKEYNWGRVRAYFYGGAVLSNRNRNSSDTSGNDFTKVDLAVGFTLDKNYIMNRSGTFFVNTFFDTRLTAIPVAAQPPTTTTPPSGLARLKSSGTVRAAADTMPDQFMTFLGSKKAGVAQAGLYMPIAITAWDNGHDPNRLFVAPLAKAGIQTITSGFTSAEGTRLGEDDVYNFFAFGTRLGHYKLKYRTDGPGLDTNVGPELISWLDLTYGKWENFDILTPEPNLILDPSGKTLVTVRERPWRVSAEGRLKIPATPFMVGFDGNFGKGPDDLRFVFGIRFDVGKLLTKLGILEKLGLDK